MTSQTEGGRSIQWATRLMHSKVSYLSRLDRDRDDFKKAERMERPQKTE